MKKCTFLFVFSLISTFTFSQWTWQNPLPQGNVLSSVYFTDENTGYAVGWFGTLLTTTDGGATWNTMVSGTNQNLMAVCFIGSNTGYIVGHGGVILTTGQGSVGFHPNPSGETLKIFPVPANDQITVEFPGQTKNASGSLSVLGIFGQELISQQSSGPLTVINVEALPAGIYYVRLVSDSKFKF